MASASVDVQINWAYVSRSDWTCDCSSGSSKKYLLENFLYAFSVNEKFLSNYTYILISDIKIFLIILIHDLSIIFDKFFYHTCSNYVQRIISNYFKYFLANKEFVTRSLLNIINPSLNILCVLYEAF